MLFGKRIQLFWQFWCPWILSEAQTQCTFYASISQLFWYCLSCMTLWIDALFLWYVCVCGSLQHSNVQKHCYVTLASNGTRSLQFSIISGTFRSIEFVFKKKKPAGSDIRILLDTNERRDSDVHNQEDCPLWRHGDNGDNVVCVVKLISCGRTQTFTVDTNKNLLEKAAPKIVSSVWQTL